MPIDLAVALAPQRCAIVTLELQAGIVGPDALSADLRADVVGRRVLEHAGVLLAGARQHQVAVLHAIHESPPVGMAPATNAPLLAAMAHDPETFAAGSPAAAIVGEAFDPGDTVLVRRFGLTPWAGTDLDGILRARNVDTVVFLGASINIGIVGAVIAAIDRGYRAAVVTDASTGIPADYADAVLAHTLRPLAVLASAAEVVDAWSRSGS